MYESLLLAWSPVHLASAAETSYRAAGLLRTKGTIFLLPPPLATLVAAYTSPPRPRTRMSAGAVALCKHFERGGASSEHGRLHPYWEVPKGSNEEKDQIAKGVLERLMKESSWRNVMLLHRGVAVYEVRNQWGWGMRWTLEVEDADMDDKDCCAVVESEIDGQNNLQHKIGSATCTTNEGHTTNDEDKSWRITKTSFRGFVEPIEGMDHEVQPLSNSSLQN